jgi:superfamily II DNA helicase RecQ
MWVWCLSCINEAHVIREWGSTFRTDYLKLGPLHYQFLQMIPYNAGSATVGNDMESELAKNLHLHKDSLAVMHHNTDRPNIFLIVEHMKHPANSYEDLAFLINCSDSKSNRFGKQVRIESR